MDKNYNPEEIESRLYESWLPYFRAHVDENKKPFTIVIPPPNVTGQLHMGHALDETLQDVLIRFKRMQGYSALWLPGTDHAGIATQIKVEENMRNNEGITRHDIGREAFLDRVWQWKEKYGQTIINQLKKLGSSCDWSRERFTMDEGLSAAVREVFVRLYEKGLIYRGYRIINFCTSCQTALSDAEVEHHPHDGNLWHIKYKLKDQDDHVIIATTRPETMLGDTAVAVNPEDQRYRHLIGKMLELPLVGRDIPIVADEYVEKDFGTGAVKITPCHDPNDFLVGQRHELPFIKIMDENGKINKNGGAYAGMDRYEARNAIIDHLQQMGALVKIEKHNSNVTKCYRCSSFVEPLTSDQWFVKMQPLVGPAVDVVNNGEIKFVPERFSKVYLNWMSQLHDWCISRQLWWGHRIPAFYCDACGHMEVSRDILTQCSKCGAPVRQDEDVLDTWFSSALWPFSTLGWPEDTQDLKYFFPTDVLVTAYDIIFFWVARMIFQSVEHMGKPPFHHVFIHGIVRDEQGRKMSKSLGNGIDPLEIIDKYGADALRFALTSGVAPGNDMRFYIEKVEAGRNFANKIWNATRFILNYEYEIGDLQPTNTLDKWIVSKYNRLAAEVTENLEKYEVGMALVKLYDFIWDDFCDWYIEMAKPGLYAGGNADIAAAVLLGTLRLLHPFMPFVTDELYRAIMKNDETIMISQFPKSQEELTFSQQEMQISAICACIKEVRALRKQLQVDKSVRPSLYINTDNKQLFEEGIPFFMKLAMINKVEFIEEPLQDAAVIVTPHGTLYIPRDEMVDREKEKQRLEAEEKRLKSEIQRAQGKLENKGFLEKAPQSLVEQEKEKLAKLRRMLEELKQHEL